jgi:alpha-L-arabinofuranosidase
VAGGVAGPRSESNPFGTNQFIDWCALVGAEPLLGMNFGTQRRTIHYALAETDATVQYSNVLTDYMVVV